MRDGRHRADVQQVAPLLIHLLRLDGSNVYLYTPSMSYRFTLRGQSVMLKSVVLGCFPCWFGDYLPIKCMSVTG